MKPLPLLQFEQKFTGTTLSDANFIYTQNKIQELNEADDASWAAVVEGKNDTYIIEIDMSGNNVINIECECGSMNEFCKHAGAVLFKIRNEMKLDGRLQSEQSRNEKGFAERVLDKVFGTKNAEVNAELLAIAARKSANLLSDWEKLPEIERNALIVAALLWEPMTTMHLATSFSNVQYSNGGNGVSASEVYTLAEKWRKLGLLHKRGDKFQVDPDFATQLCDQQFLLQPDFFQKASLEIDRNIPYVSYNSWNSVNYSFRNMRLARYCSDAEKFKTYFEAVQRTMSREWSEDKLATFWLGKPTFNRAAMERFPNAIQLFFCEFLLNKILLKLSEIDADFLLFMEENLVEFQRNPDSILAQRLAILAIFRGDMADLRVKTGFLQQTWSMAAFRGIEAFLIGQNPAAIDFFELSTKELRKETRRAKDALGGLPGVFHVLALLRANDVAQFPKLENIFKQNFQTSQWPSYALFDLQHYFQKIRDDKEQPLYTHSYESASSKFWRFMIQFWHSESRFETSRENIDFLNLLNRNKYAWLAAEMSAVLNALVPKSTDDSTDFFEKTGIVSMTNLLPKVENWEKALQVMLQIGAKSPKKVAEQGATRLIWHVDFDRMSLEAREQTLGKKGWTQGRAVAGERLSYNKVESMTEQDRRITKGFDYYGRAKPESWKALVGHPLLFLSKNQEIAIQLLEEKPTLTASKSADGSFQLKFTPAITEEGYKILKETPTRFKYFEVTAEQARLAKSFGEHGLRVPDQGIDRLREALEGMSSVVEIRSAFDAEDENIPSVKADARICVHLLPVGDGFQVEFFVKPFSTTPPYFPPGEQESAIVGLLDGQKVRTVRDLKLEKKNSDAIRKAIPVLTTIRRNSGGIWDIEDADQCLELLTEIFPVVEKGDITLEWPKGEKYKIQKLVGFDQFRMSIGEKNNWFEVRGELRVDENRVLSMAELLVLSEKQKGQFIELSPGKFLALTAEFRRQLKAISSLMTPQKNGAMQLHPLAASAMSEFTDAMKNIEFDEKFAENRKRLEAAFLQKFKVPKNFKAELRPYQTEGFEWLHRAAAWGVGAILADDMGLGKTIQCLAFLTDRAKIGPALVVAPASVCRNWMAETEKFAPALTPYLFSENDREKLLKKAKPGDLIIVTYDMMTRESELFISKKWATVVLDEAQAIKNRATKRSETVMQLDSDCRLLMSGTPVENHLGELWNLMQFANPGLLGSLDNFNEKFAMPIEKLKDSNRQDQLRRLVQPFILRRRKDEVLKELPAKTEITLNVQLSPEERAFYEALRRRAIEAMESDDDKTGGKHLKILAQIMKLRRAACHPKLADENSGFVESSKLRLFGEVVEELLENGHRALVFSQFVSHLAILEEYLQKKKITYQYLDGSTPLAKRQERIEKFQAGEGDLFLISLKAGGTGLNLTGADYVIHMDPWWNPAVEDQATDRAHRIGQTKPVTVYRIVAENTIEEKILQLHAKKRDLADALLTGADGGAKLSADDLMGLLRER
jgi:SNF2 family DNA or RNA helicase